MAKTTVFTCDICKKSKDEKDLAKIEVRTRGIIIRNTAGSLSIDICSECLKKKGFFVEPKDEELEQANIQNKATLEDKIYDILEDLGVAFTE